MKRVLLLLALSATFGLALVAVAPVGAVQAAQQSVPVSSAPPALNILPSSVTGAVGTTEPWRLQAVYALMYKSAKHPEFWQALNNVNAGVGTPAEVQKVTAGTSGYAVPATKLGTLTRAAGAVGAAISVFQLSQFASNGVMELVGFDANGLVCETGAQWVSIVTGQDCSSFGQIPDEYLANVDARPGVSGSNVCDSSGRCMQLVKVGTPTTANGNVINRYCLTATGNINALVITTTTISTPTTVVTLTSDANTYEAACGSPRYTPGGRMLQLTQPAQGTLLTYNIPTNNGAAAPVQTSTSDPERRMKCVVAATNGQTYTAFSDPYTEGGSVLPQPVCPDLPQGVYPQKTTVWDTGGPDERKLWEQDTTPEFQKTSTEYPECMTGRCMLDLAKNGISCFQAVEACTDWLNDPNKTDTMTCRYGTHVVPLSECNVYGPTFKPDATTKGDTLGNPGTGQPAPNPNPGTGTDSQAGTRPVTDPDAPGERQCFPTGWGVLNPVEWVMKPTQCALEWAFVPRQSVLTAQLTRVATAWDDTIVLQIPRMIGAWAIDVPAGGCGGLIADMGFLPGEMPDVPFFNACPGDPLAPFAGIIKPWLTVSFVIAVGMSMYASVSMVVGANK